MKIPVIQTPTDAYTLSGIEPETCVEIQNKTTRDIMIYSGDEAPASLDDYFMLRSYKWHKHIGTVIMLYAGLPTHVVIKESC